LKSSRESSMSNFFYQLARWIRDLEVLGSGNPGRMIKRLANKAVGRNIVRRLWWR
jgi:hypothetical protein